MGNRRGGVKHPHHRGSFATEGKRVRDRANADPSTRCWRCGRTMAEIRTVKPTARWTAGHVVDGQCGGVLAPECSGCNYAHGAAHGNALRRGVPKRAKRLPPTLPPSIQW